jgi:hypothetical protein
MPARTHRRRNFKKRNHTKRNTRRNTKRRLNSRIKRTKRYTRKRGGRRGSLVQKSDRKVAEEAAEGKNLELRTIKNELGVDVKQYYDPVRKGWYDDAPKGMATKLAMRWKGEEGVDKFREIREGTKILGRAGKAVGEVVLYPFAAAASVMG